MARPSKVSTTGAPKKAAPAKAAPKAAAAKEDVVVEAIEKKAGIIKKVFMAIVNSFGWVLSRCLRPLFTDRNTAGEYKVSIGRAPLAVVLVIMCYMYATTGKGPDAGVLAFIGMALAYNGFSKKAHDTQA